MTDVDYPNCSITEMLKESVRRFASHRAIVFNDQILDFTAFDDQSDRVAKGLIRQGVQQGDRIGLYCANSDCFAIAYFAILKAGATVVPINLLLNPREVAYIVKDAGTKGLIYHEAFAEAVSAIRGEMVRFDPCICIGQNKSHESDLLWDQLPSSTGPVPELSINPADDVAVILYTSGTTGFPKGAMLTHRNLISNTCSIKAALHLEPRKDVLLVVLPMFHSFAATVGMLFPLLHGCTILPLPKFDPEGVARVIEKWKATIFMAVPSMFHVMCRLRDEFTPKLASLRFAVSGGAALPMETMERFEKRFGKLIYEGDGPTECSPVTCVNPIGGKRKAGSVGLPVPGVEMSIRDESGKECPTDQIGEICVRGPNVMKGYWKLADETAASFFDEWFRTGDLGSRDADGYFYIVDRKKDMIIVNGMNVYPRVIENVLHQHSEIREAAVVGELNSLHGEIPIAFVTLKENSRLTTAEVTAFCRKYLGRHEIPRKIISLSELPKNPTGKILKRELRRHGEVERGVELPR